ncbi:MAG: HYR domain-containing protein [Bacteroidota bacterium]
MINLTSNPIAGLAKRTVLVQTQPNGSANVTFEFNIKNLGNVDIKNLALIDNLTAAFPATCAISVVSLTSDDYVINPSFTGTGNNNLLAPGNTLTVGNKGAVLLTINLLNCGAATQFNNTATLNGTAPNGSGVTDVSDNGSEPDPDGDGNPNETGENDPTPIDINCILPQSYTVTLKTCALGQGMLMGDFNFTNLHAAELATTNTFNGPVPAGLVVTFHNSLEDANADQNPLTNVYNSQTANIWVRIERSNNSACYSIDVVHLIVNQVPILLLSKTDETCSVSNDGTANVFVTNNQGAYNYDWSNLAGTNNPSAQTGLNGGVYTVTVTDGNGCISTGSVSVAEGPVLTLASIPNIGPLCPGQKTIQPTLLSATPVNQATVYTWSGGAVAGLPNGTTTGLNPVIPGFNATTVEGVYTVTVTAALGALPNQCFTSTTFTITINDATPPVFNNCPTSMVMIGNDPDQCSGKLNWSIPTATDECAIFVGITQTGGPLSGSVIAITCPPTPQTITYTANDGNGNTSTCTFQVMVVDTQKPEFDADIIMPNDTTVNCHQVPTNCVYHGPNVCTPLTKNDVHDNCTSPQNINIAYNEISTQNPNPAVCGHYTYDLTRTWTITDCAGNALLHTQKIHVQDTTKPVAVCKSIAITLDKFGKASITPADINNGSYDNCAGAPYLTYSVTPNQFTCANTGANTVTLKVTDPCGNFSTCTAIVTVVEGIAPCTPQYSVQTNCLDNATDENNGQFEEIITVKSLAMQTWTLNANSGLYAANSPAPPASPILIPAGTAFAAGTADGIDNDHDGQTDEADEMIFYTLRARFVECVGYSLSIGNTGNIGAAPAATTATIANKACYPNPYFLNLYDPFCLYTPPFTIQVGEYNNAVGNVINVMVDGVPTTIFDAAALGVGAHTVMATFDAGTATTNLVINGVQVGGSMANAIADPGCKQKITKVVNVVATPTTVVCNDLVYVSLDADCTETLNADDVLEGTYYCFDDYKVEIDKVLPFGNGPWTPGTVNASDIGKTYFYHVVHPISGNVCWGQIKIEDKLAPALTCPANITVACSESIGPDHTGNIGIQDCSATTTVIDDNVLDNGECGAPRQIITRTFIVTDAWGNQSTCVQTITVVPFDLGAVIFPADITVNCESAYLNPNATNPNTTGRPSINGAPIGQGTLCSASISYTDERYEICAGSYEILRTWKIRNTCLALSANNPTVHTQIIRVKDFGGPVFACPPAVVVSTDPYQCCATAALPDMIVSEGCSKISNLEAKVTGTNPANGNIITFTVPGHLGDFPGNNYWNPDTLAIFTHTQCLPLGVYTVQYSAADQCGNTSKCAFQMTVADLVPPTAACDQFTQVDLGGDGTSLVNASTFDDGSKDNCAPVEFKVRRMQPNGCQSDTAFYDQVKFCCSDINDTIQVVFRVYDVDVPAGEVGRESYEGHYNDCMVQVLVKDKIKPICNAPANTTVDCENFDPSLWAYGAATATDNCCIDTITHSVNYSQFDTVCNRGTLTRTFRAFDCAGQSTQCTQRVVVNYLQDYYIKFPNDAIVTTCDGTGIFGEPTFFGKDCELMGISFEDQIFTVVPDACFEIERTWKIINWCTFNPNLPLIAVPNPNPNATSNSPQNLPGPIVSAPETAAPWTATVVKVLPTDATATNYATFWNNNANGYVYKQIIKITDTQDPTVENCPDSLVTYCDVTQNDPLLWNASYWWDNLIGQHDLCEGPSDLTITATDACSGSNINIHYLLFLDLDGDGTMESVVNSESTGVAGGLPWNTVFFGNANGPNFIGGTARNFDGRAVPNNQKYGFALQTTVQGNKRIASVRWNTQQNQNNFVVPELPYGKHKIKWIIEDGCGNESFCEYNFEVKDCKKPTVVCLNGLSVNIMPTQMIQLWASDFQQYAEDNCTPANQVKIGIRRSGTGTGFPKDKSGNPITSVNFTCDDLGTQLVELWGLDLAGNADYCETYVIVQDNAGNCVSDPNAAKVAGALATESNNGVEEGSVAISGSGNGIPTFNFTTMTSTQGAYNFNAVPKSTNSTVTPLKDDNPLNGVSTYDLVLISKHILGIEPLNSPYKMIAADANKSGSITTFDIVELRKLILGIYSELPFNTSWRFVDKSFAFPNPLNPFQTQFPETKLISDIQSNHIAEDFVSVKVGDVNGTVIANSLMNADDRAAGTLLLDVNSPTPTLPGREGDGAASGISGRDAGAVRAGEIFTVTLTPDQIVQGYQFTLNTKGLEVVDIAGLKGENYAVFTDAITFSVDGPTAQNVISLTFEATKPGKLSNMLSISSRITKAEAYAQNPGGTVSLPLGADKGGALNVALRFNAGSTQTISGVGFELYQNQPNPFVDKTFIGFNLPLPAEARSAQAGASSLTTVTLTVYDETGRLLHTQKGDFAKGYNSFMLEKALLKGTGVLYYKVETATDSATKQMIQSE